MPRFKILVNETKEIYLSNYDWYYMPISLHKLLIHSPDVILSFFIPIGQLSEEALECRHKDIRHIREHNARKSSRINTNRDIMTMLLLTSDPGLAKFRKVSSSHTKNTSDIAEYIIDDNQSETFDVSLDSDRSSETETESESE